MPVALKVPSVGESITEVEIGEWLKKEGDFVSEDEPVAVIETEKVTVDLPAPVSGNVSKILIKTGNKANVGDVIGYVEEAAPPANNGQQPVSETAASPLAVPPSEASAEKPKEAPASVKEPPPQQKQRPSVEKTDRREDAVPLSHIRRRIAERLVAAQRNAALLTTFNQIDMTSVIDLRKTHEEAFRQKHGVKLGLMSFFVKATVSALKQIPQINAEIRGESIIYHDYYDIGIAIGAESGLVVPVLRNAERLSFAEIEKAIVDFAERARSNRLKVDELQGGTFTISNGGVYGSLLSTPIVNPPQSGVLGLHVIEERPVVRQGQIVARPMMYVALTYDHRIVDGREAVTFLRRIRESVEEPSRLLLDV